MRRRPPLWVLAALGGAGALLAGCGIPTEDTARRVQNVGPVVPPPAASTTTQPKPVTPQAVFWVQNSSSKLVFEQVGIPGNQTLTAVIETLLGGPGNTKESRTGWRTALVGGIQLIGSRSVATPKTHDKRIVTVRFNPYFGLLAGHTQALAVAQVVFTLAAFYGTDPPGTPAGTRTSVQFEVTTAVEPIPVSNGTLVTDAVTTSDYVTEAPACPATAALRTCTAAAG